MITISLSEKDFTLEIKGHANADEGPEYKYICSNVSTIAQGLAYSLTKYEKSHEAIDAMDYRPDPGDFLLKVRPQEWARATIRRRMQICGDMLEMLAICESSYITMTWDGEKIKPQTEEEANDNERV